MERTVRKVLSMHFASYAQEQRMPRYVHQAAWRLQRCRTAALGGHVHACPEGHFERIVFHSCRHRLCPQCNTLPREQWLVRMRERLIDCAHHHVIFTIPHDLHGLWRFNRVWFTQALFTCAAQTLHTLCADERYLGARAGFVSALHTWGRSLSFHPHLHCLISDGGVDAQGQWRAPRKRCFLPVRVLMALFRGKLLARVRAALASGELRLPPDLTAQRASNLLNRLGRVKWNVHLRERYEHGRGVMTYLARYVRGGALSNTQLAGVDEQQVVFRYTPHGSPREAVCMKLSPAQFLARYLQHAPLPGVPVVRHYGVYATANTAQLARARERHLQPALPAARRVMTRVYYFQHCAPQHAQAMQCPTCQAALIVRERLGRAPAPS